MKNRIFMYLFIFTVLLVLFQYMNSKNIHESNILKIENSETQLKRYKDSILKLNDKITDLSYFSFDSNEKAYDYFYNKGFNVSKLIPTIKDGLYAQNVYKGEEHPLIPYASSEGNKMQINIIRVLNHKWIIADFTDGQFEGELFLNYAINDKGELTYKLIDSFLYPL